jgi:hypothetical protein
MSMFSRTGDVRQEKAVRCQPSAIRFHVSNFKSEISNLKAELINFLDTALGSSGESGSMSVTSGSTLLKFQI